MTCPVCRHRKARRACPALGQTICAVCCGTKRVVEIACPETCGYLSAARLHPPVAVQRQQQQDFGFLVPTVRDLTEPQQQLFFLLVTKVLAVPDEPLQRLHDEDVAEAAAALAGTFETAAKGVIYEQDARTRMGRQVLEELKAIVEAVGAEIPRARLERDAAHALRALERGARDARTALGESATAYLDLLRRTLPAVPRTSAPPETALEPGSGLERPTLIVPPYEA